MFKLVILMISFSGILASDSTSNEVMQGASIATPCLTLTPFHITPATSPCCQDGSFFLIAAGDSSFVGDLLILYLSDGTSTKRLSISFVENLVLDFSVLFPGTYTLQGFIVDAANTLVCSSDCYSIVIPSKSSDCCPLIVCANSGPYISMQVGGFVSLAISPESITTTTHGIPYTFASDWTFTTDPSDP